LEYGAKKIIAVDVGTQQLHESLRSNPAIELHEEMDIRNFRTDQKIDWIVVDVSFIAIENIFDAIIRFCSE
jgi:23S rRNA (cytidine1920-2'-O)/16S rRNA (cytidine1409-2'-O)-methyltransferase